MKIVIVGGGAIGRLFGYFLVKGSNEITLIANDPKTFGALQEKRIGLIADDERHPDEAESFPDQSMFCTIPRWARMFLKPCTLTTFHSFPRTEFLT